MVNIGVHSISLNVQKKCRNGLTRVPLQKSIKVKVDTLFNVVKTLGKHKLKPATRLDNFL